MMRVCKIAQPELKVKLEPFQKGYKQQRINARWNNARETLENEIRFATEKKISWIKAEQFGLFLRNKCQARFSKWFCLPQCCITSFFTNTLSVFDTEETICSSREREMFSLSCLRWDCAPGRSQHFSFVSLPACLQWVTGLDLRCDFLLFTVFFFFLN